MNIRIPNDYHMHTDFSTDSRAPMEEMIRSAIDKGLSEIALTDHVDFDFPRENELDEPSFLVDYNEYIRTFYPLRERYQDRIKILFGVEIGLQHHVKPSILQLLRDFPFDFVIGSIHTVNRMDVYASSYHKGKTKEESYTEYFRYALSCTTMYDCYDVFGHLDYINRYGNYGDRILHYSDYRDLIDEILKTILAGGKGIEINTSGYRYGLSQTHPQEEILKRYLELGGEIITVGSDAHRPEDISSHFNIVAEIAQRVGIKYLTRFRNRKPEMYRLDV